MKKKILIIPVLFLILILTGCSNKIKQSELYGLWQGNILENSQSFNGFVVTKTDYNLNLFANGNFTEEISILSRNIQASGDGNTTTYSLEGSYTVEPQLGIKLIVTNWETNNSLITGLPTTMSNQMLYFDVVNNKLNLCIDAMCDNVLIKTTNN